MDFELRRTNLADLSHLLPLMEACFDFPPSLAYCRWKYLENPAGPLVAFEAYADDRLAGFYGVIPEDYLVDGERVKVYQAMDLMTHPDFQRKGLFAKLGSLTYRTIVEEQGRISLIGVPNYHILPGHTGKLNSAHIRSSPYLFAPRAWFKLRSAWRGAGDLAAEVVSAVPPDYPAYLSRRERSTRAISPVYSAEFLSWRFLRHPFRKYKLVAFREGGALAGICVLELEGTRAKIMLLDFARRADFSRLGRRAIAAVFGLIPGAATLYTWEPTDPHVLAAYIGSGFLKNPLGRGPFSHRIPFITYTAGSAAAPEKWRDASCIDLQPAVQD